jgi:hypothetical protein
VTASAPEVPRSFRYFLRSVVIGLAAIAIFLGFRSCSGGSDSDTRKVSEEAALRAKERVADARTDRSLRSYLRENFSETTWYQDIERIEVTPTFVNVYTRSTRTPTRQSPPAQSATPSASPGLVSTTYASPTLWRSHRVDRRAWRPALRLERHACP